MNQDAEIVPNQNSEIVPMNQDAESVPMNQNLEIIPINQNAEIVPVNQDDSLEVILSQNLVENDNDSFDDMVSQVDEQEYRQNDSLNELISQSDNLRAERSANSKVNDWLATAKPKSTENLTIARREKVNENKENFPVVRKKKLLKILQLNNLSMAQRRLKTRISLVFWQKQTPKLNKGQNTYLLCFLENKNSISSISI